MDRRPRTENIHLSVSASPLELSTWIILEIVGIGLVAGTLGGLAGIGGSMIMLPALHWVLGDEPAHIHHTYMAAAMTVNIAVALPAAWRHNASGTVRHDLVRKLIATTLVSVILGVFLGNLFQGDVLRFLLAVFLLVYCGFNCWRLLRPSLQKTRSAERVSTRNLTICAGSTGLIGGMLGLGGGVMLVPLLQLLCRVPLKQSIATSSAVIWISAIVGASVKMATLSGEGGRWQDAALLAGLLAPTAIVGGVLGAVLTQRLPVKAVRAVITVLLAIAAVRLLA